MVVGFPLDKFYFNFESGFDALAGYVSHARNTPGTKLVGVAGGSCSGKGTLVPSIVGEMYQRFGRESSGVQMLVGDDYYEDRPETDKGKPDWAIDYDDPNALSLEMLGEHFGELLVGRTIQKPIYSWGKGSKGVCGYRKGFESLEPSSVVLVDSFYALRAGLADYLDLKVFMYADDDRRLSRRIERDTKHRGKSEVDVKIRWNLSVQKWYLSDVLPTMNSADVVIFNNGRIDSRFFDLAKIGHGEM